MTSKNEFWKCKECHWQFNENINNWCEKCGNACLNPLSKEYKEWFEEWETKREEKETETKEGEEPKRGRTRERKEKSKK
jgi:uncharacterized cysteine cluster protein YcgN (CxxCxxCC family)